MIGRGRSVRKVMLGDGGARIEVFQELELVCPDGDKLREALRESARSPWRHSLAGEKAVGKSALDDVDIIVFDREEADGVPAARLVLWPQPDGYRVANVVPTQCRELGEGGYNDVLDDFVDNVARPAAEREGFGLQRTRRRQSIADWTSREAADALRLFSVAANKSTGSSHPMDASRWRRFLIAEHLAGGSIDSSCFRRWLVEVEGWSIPLADELAAEHSFAAELLREYDDRVRGLS